MAIASTATQQMKVTAQPSRTEKLRKKKANKRARVRREMAALTPSTAMDDVTRHVAMVMEFRIWADDRSADKQKVPEFVTILQKFHAQAESLICRETAELEPSLEAMFAHQIWQIHEQSRMGGVFEWYEWRGSSRRVRQRFCRAGGHGENHA